jgi:hypothetical protein
LIFQTDVFLAAEFVPEASTKGIHSKPHRDIMSRIIAKSRYSLGHCLPLQQPVLLQGDHRCDFEAEMTWKPLPKSEEAVEASTSEGEVPILAK